MENPGNNKNPLISGIESNAMEESKRTIKEAEKQAAERKKYLEQQVGSILREAHEKARAESDAIKNKLLSGVDVEIKRKKMQYRDKILNEIQDRVKKELRSLIEKDGYREALIYWITEAMIGLGVESAFVNASAAEKSIINERLLDEAEKMVKNITGRGVKLKLSGEPPAGSQGVVLTAEDGRTAFKNRVDVRLLRKQQQITKLIYQKLFDEA